MKASRASTLATLRHLRAIGVAKPRRRMVRIPRQQHPVAIAREYAKAIDPVCDLASRCAEAVLPEILRRLVALRAEQGHADAAPAAPPLARYGDLLGALVGQLGTPTLYGQTAVGPLIRFDVPGPGPVVVVVTGQHGEEQAGPHALARHGAQLVARAQALGVALRIYPCVNPEGYDAGRRRDRSGNTNANSFIEYRVGEAWRGDLEPGMAPDESRRPAAQAPETAALYDDLVPWALSAAPAALLDIHQDSILHPGYCFGYLNSGPRAEWAAILARAATPLAKMPLKNASWTKVKLRTGPDGLVMFRDGSITDWAAAAGVWRSLALEGPISDPAGAIEIARVVMLGLVDRVGAARADAGHGLAHASNAGRKAREEEEQEARRLASQLSAASREGKRAAALIDDAAGRFADAFRPHELIAVTKKFGKRTSDFQMRQLDAQVRAAMGIPFTAIEKPVRDQVDEWAAHNVDLIVTVPARYFDRLRLDVEDAFERGTHPSALADDFEERYDMSRRDAERIARDQVGKLAAQVNTARQKSLGIEYQVWRSMNDNRVCDECFEKDGERYRIDDPPGGCLPGECHPEDRCYGEPDFSDLLGED